MVRKSWRLIFIMNFLSQRLRYSRGRAIKWQRLLKRVNVPSTHDQITPWGRASTQWSPYMLLVSLCCYSLLPLSMPSCQSWVYPVLISPISQIFPLWFHYSNLAFFFSKTWKSISNFLAGFSNICEDGISLYISQKKKKRVGAIKQLFSLSLI